MKPEWVPVRRWARAAAVAGALGLSAGVASAAQAPAPPPAKPADAAATQPPTDETPRPRQVEARADELMKKMSALLARTPRFALEAEETFDEVYPNAPRVQLTNVRRVAVQRPNRFAGDATGDTLNRAVWYDGKTITALDKEENRYLTVEMPATIDAVLDKLADDYKLVVPLSDLVYADAYATLMEGVVFGEYLGVHQAAGVPCHHLAFSQEDIDWQIWIDAGEQPLPRKLLISYAEEPGAPQYTATIRRWNLDPKFAEGLFTFEAPEGAQRITLPAPSPGAPAAPGEEKKEKSR
jgi:hypothetical protein